MTKGLGLGENKLGIVPPVHIFVSSIIVLPVTKIVSAKQILIW